MIAAAILCGVCDPSRKANASGLVSTGTAILAGMTGFGRYLWRLLPGNPMVTRIVWGGGRRLPHLWVRMGYLGALILLVLVGLLSQDALEGTLALDQLARAGSWVFAVIAYGQVILICLLAPLFMAGAIASEQSGKTYNILLTTPLSNLQIVLGSLAGRLLFILALLASGLPLFSVLLVFGGVPAGAVLVSFAVAGMVAVTVGAIAVTMSVLRAGGRRAVFAFVIANLAFLLLLYLLDSMVLRRVNAGTPWAGHTTWVTPLHPLLVLESAINRANYAPPGEELVGEMSGLVRFYLARPFETFLVWTGVLSGGLLVACSLGVRRVAQGESRAWRWVRLRLRLPAPGAERRRAARSIGLANPVAWREANTRGKLAGGILARWGFLVLAVGGAGALLWRYHHDGYWGSTGASRGQVSLTPDAWLREGLSALLLIEVTVVVLVALYVSAGSVSREREDGTLDIMLTTPITPKQYVWGKLRGLVMFLSVLLAAPVATALLVSGYAWWGQRAGWVQATYVWRQGSGVGTGGFGVSVPDVPLMYPEAPLVLAVMLVPTAALCVAIGMQFSLTNKSVISAVVKAVVPVAVVSAFFGFCGFRASSTIEFVGPALNAMSPATNVLMLTQPFESVARFGESTATGRISIALGAIFAAVVYGLVVWSLLSTMVKHFDQTVRRLSGGS